MKTRIYFLISLLSATAFSISPAAFAQNKAGAASDTLTIKALKASGQWGDKQGLKLEGTAAQPAHVTHPQLDIKAPKIDVSFDDTRQLKNVVASGGVQFKVSLTQKDEPPVRIEAKCDNANLDRTDAARVLTLNGGVDGWFQSGDGPRNALRGQTVKITSQPDSATTLVADIKGDTQGIRVGVPPSNNAAPNAKPITITAQNAQLRQSKSGLDADVDGGTQGVRLEIPPQPKSTKTAALEMGAVVITSQRASVRQAEGIARFTGNAHALSSGDGQAKFDVTADELNLTRTAAGTIDALKTKGRTRLKLDLPPDGKPLVNTNNNSVSKPNYWEVESNTATVEISKNTLTFEGNIKGFYRLAANATQMTDYPFSGERAVIIYVPETGDIARDLKFSFEGEDPTKVEKPKQVEIEIPAFRF